MGVNGDGEALAFIDGNESLDNIVIDDEIVGLSLTKRILEDNGFDQNGAVGKKCKYVHELQHSLIDCEIEKKIKV